MTLNFIIKFQSKQSLYRLFDEIRSIKAMSTYSVNLIYAFTSLFADSIGIDFVSRKNIIKLIFSRSKVFENDTSPASPYTFYSIRKTI